jgi:hypothetical protein
VYDSWPHQRGVRDLIQHFPARPLTPNEHAIVAEWLAGAGDIASAYVSDRLTDDPALYRCVVVITDPAYGPSQLVHSPVGQDVWIVFSLGQGSNVQTYPTLPAALNSIRPVLSEVALERHHGNRTVG